MFNLIRYFMIYNSICFIITIIDGNLLKSYLEPDCESDAELSFKLLNKILNFNSNSIYVYEIILFIIFIPLYINSLFISLMSYIIVKILCFDINYKNTKIIDLRQINNENHIKSSNINIKK